MDRCPYCPWRGPRAEWSHHRDHHRGVCRSCRDERAIVKGPLTRAGVMNGSQRPGR